MFDVGFWELVVIGVVALLVFGPEKLPGLARTAGFWVGKARRQFTQLRSELERELAMEDVRRMKQKVDIPEIRGLADDIRNASSLGGKPGGSEPPSAGTSQSNPEVRR